MTITIRLLLLSVLMLSLMGGFIPDTVATHISKPVLKEYKVEYDLGEKIVLVGWVDYNDQPTSDVLLNVKVFQPEGVELLERSIVSDERGYFRMELETENLSPGNYRIVVTSHCREVHRSICNYRNEALTIRLKQ